MLFSEVIGQSATKQHLAEMVEHNRLSHALLFLGKEGVGGLPLAMAFAQYIVSLPPDAPLVEDLFGGMTALAPTTGFIHPDQITEQASFKRAAQLMHPDLHFTYPVITKKPGEKPTSADFIEEWRNFIQSHPYGNVYDWLQSIGAENKQGNISKLECDHILHKLSLKSFESPWKILIMWMPEYLGNMGNRLLKLIEEPPPNTLFLLVTENEEAILPTILSRCQLIRVGLPANEDIENALVLRNGVDRERARQISMVAEGNYHEALQMLQHNDADWQSLLRQWLNAAIKGTPKMQQDWIAEMNELGREKQKQFLKYFVNLLEQSIRVRVLGPERLILPDAEMDFAQRLNKIAGINQQEALVKELEQASYYIERNANAKMLFQALTLKLRSIVLEKTILLQH